jgi:hypothetical protein
MMLQIGLLELVLNAGPYVQKQTLRRKGCQIDLLLRTRRSFYVFEIKCRKHVETMARHLSYRRARMCLTHSLT